MKCGFYTPKWPPGAAANGIVTYVKGIRAGALELGADVMVFSPRIEGAAAKEPGVVSVEPTLARLLRVCGAGDRVQGMVREPLDAGLRRHLRQALASGLQVFEMEESFGLIDLLDVPGLTRVVRLHGPWFLNGPAVGVAEDDAYRERVLAEGRGIAGAHAVSAPSLEVLEQVRNQYELELEHARVIPNPVEDIPSDMRWTAEGSTRGQLLFVGRFDRHKGGDVMFDAFERIAREDPGSSLVFVGPDRGFRDDSGRTWTLDEFMNARLSPAVRSRVRVLGFQAPSVIQRLRRESAVTIVPSRYETFAMTAAEAICAGAPTVAANIGGIPEVVTPETGLLFAAGDANDLANQVLRLLRDPELQGTLARAARRDYEARFTPEIVARATLEFYQQARSSRGAPAALASS